MIPSHRPYLSSRKIRIWKYCTKKKRSGGSYVNARKETLLAFLRTLTRLETTCGSFPGPALLAFSFLSSTETQFFPLHERLLHGWEHDGIRFLFSKCIREARTFSGKTWEKFDVIGLQLTCISQHSGFILSNTSYQMVIFQSFEVSYQLLLAMELCSSPWTFLEKEISFF